MPTTSVLGGQSEATIDQANIAMRAMPWYQDQMRAWGMDPGHPGNLSDSQRTQLTRAAQANGFVVDEGNIEMDDHGNFNPIGHKLRNTLIVAGLAAATIATMGAAGVFAGGAGVGAGAGSAAGGVLEGTAAGAGGSTALAAGVPAGVGAVEGGAYGLSDAALASMGGAAGTGAGVGAGAGAGAAGAGAFDAAGNFIGNSTYYIPAGGGGASLATDLLKYALPTAGGIAGSLIAANASGNASAAQQKYLEEALAYEKENDLYNRGVAAQKVQLEAGRYADYTGRITPFVANATSANDRMSSLLGLPPRPAGTYSPGGAGSSGSSYGTQTPSGVAVSPQLTQRILDNYKALGLTPTGPGSGPTDSAYYTQQYAGTGGSTAANDAYWFGPQGRIATDAQKAGLSFTPGAPPPTAPTTPPTSPTPGPAPITGAPVAKSLVQLRAPDGSVRGVPPDQVDQYLARGATRVEAGA
jgi:hypothetical protein